MKNETQKTGVIVVDVQGDFTTYRNGSLAVEGTDQTYLETVKKNTEKLKEAGFPLYATQDWHPSDHISFFTIHKGRKAFDVISLHGKEQVLWPPHCVQKTPGAELLLDKNLFKAVVRKGMDPQYDSYSGFQDDGGKKTDLDKLLKKEKISKVIVYGIAAACLSWQSQPSCPTKLRQPTSLWPQIIPFFVSHGQAKGRGGLLPRPS